MPHPRALALFFVLLMGLLAGPARAQDSTLTCLIRQHQLPLVAAGAQFSGLGWDELRLSIQQSQFVLVGEDHGLAQIPGFTAAVAQVLQPAVFVAEIDPYVARDLTMLAAQPGPPTAYLQQYPEALCFYSLAEEFELIRTLRAQHVQLVGLDQVFITTAARFYARLAEQANGRPARACLQQQAAKYQAQGQVFEREGKDRFSMSEQRPSAVDSLVAVTRQEGPAVRQMVQDYVTSYQIYRTYETRAPLPNGLSAHQARLNLMRRNLLNIKPERPGSAGQPLPKMLFKFGANHLGRGLSIASFGEFYDVGNLALSLAEAQDKQSLHIMIVGKQGTQARGSNQVNRSQNVAAYTAADNAYLQPYFGQTPGPAWNVVDLRPARRALGAGKLVASQQMQRVLLDYDYLVVIPETTASRTY
ncbi:hypothetical protein ACFQ48_16265 [Hymenobacter caeli]|uniref:Erythromycin esterase family protein n=1 Tax=Hymenobacter caeli TaxID=2735894 RepID=A0ABX2FWM2_9BACT|nr:hypothetical protein [Hymenobacter caeli]NRT20704.1 hypothetical protein [Hymenobacter caeli]